MIRVTHLNGDHFLINCDQIEFVEISTGTVISFVSGKKIRVVESPEEIVKLITAYKRSIYFADSVEIRKAPED